MLKLGLTIILMATAADAATAWLMKNLLPVLLFAGSGIVSFTTVRVMLRVTRQEVGDLVGFRKAHEKQHLIEAAAHRMLHDNETKERNDSQLALAAEMAKMNTLLTLLVDGRLKEKGGG